MEPPSLHTSPIDPVTRCLNRSGLQEHAQAAFARRGNIGSLLMLEVDSYAELLASYGRVLTNGLLSHVADVVRSVIRGDDALARMSPDGFAVVLPGCTSYQTADIAERIRMVIACTPFDYGDGQLRVSVTIGVVQKFDDVPFSVDDWIPQADDCLSEAREQGRNRVVMAG